MSNFVKRFPAISQFLLAFVIGTGILIPINSGILPKSLFFLAAFSASIAGVILTAVVSGKPGLKHLFKRLGVWKVGIKWWLYALLIKLGIVLLGMIINALSGMDSLDLKRIPEGLGSFMPFFIMLMITGGLGEELGWRGFMLPRLQARYNALVASIIVGVLHGLWHVPMFFIEGLSPYQEMADASNIIIVIMGYGLFYVTPWAVLWTCLLNNTKGSLLLACILHAGEAWVLCSWNIENPASFIGAGIAMTITAIVVIIIFGPQRLSISGEKYIIKD